MKFFFIQNTLAPYRADLFNKLIAYGLDVTVLYECRQESDRLWEINLNELKYPYTIYKGFYKMIKGYHFHFNPNLIKKLMSVKGNIVLGSSWNDLNIILICLLKRIGLIKSDIIFWSEANYLTIGAVKKNFFRDKLRKYILNSGNGTFILPGKMAEKTLTLWHINLTNIYFLPNVIKEDTINQDINRPVLTENDMPIFILPARLEEKIKGILNFFQSIGIENIKKAIFYICGDGNDKDKINSFIQNFNLQKNIILKGFCSQKTMSEMYETANAFVLPSFSDPSPLSIVEAIANKLPLLISNRCGNHFETLIEGVNGYSFDPTNKNDIKNSYENLIKQKSKWKEMGERGRELYNQNFKQSVVIPKFCSALQQR